RLRLELAIFSLVVRVVASNEIARRRFVVEISHASAPEILKGVGRRALQFIVHDGQSLCGGDLRRDARESSARRWAKHVPIQIGDSVVSDHDIAMDERSGGAERNV